MKRIERQAFVKIFLLLFFTSSAIFSLFLGGSYAYENFLSFENKLPEQAMVGVVNVGGLKESEAYTVLNEHIEKWKRDAVVEVHFFDEAVSIPIEELEFDINESIQIALKEGFANFIPKIRLAMLEEKVKELSFPNISQIVSLQFLQKGLEQELFTLHNETIMLDLNEYLYEEEKIVPDVVVSVSKNVQESAYLTTLVDALNGTTIEKHSVFSLLQAIESQGRTALKTDELNIVASALYELLLKTNFTVVERHIGLKIPSYTEIGLDAIAIPNEADLKFLNSNVYEYEIRTKLENNQLTFELYGIPFLYTFEIEVEKERIEPRKIVHFSSKLSIGDVQTVRYGRDGYLATVYKVVRNRSHALVDKIEISEDYYPPVHQIEERSLYVPPIDDVQEETNEEDNEIENSFENDEESNLEEEIPPIGEQPIYEDPMSYSLQEDIGFKINKYRNVVTFVIFFFKG